MGFPFFCEQTQTLSILGRKWRMLTPALKPMILQPIKSSLIESFLLPTTVVSLSVTMFSWGHWSLLSPSLCFLAGRPEILFVRRDGLCQPGLELAPATIADQTHQVYGHAGVQHYWSILPSFFRSLAITAFFLFSAFPTFAWHCHRSNVAPPSWCECHIQPERRLGFALACFGELGRRSTCHKVNKYCGGGCLQ